MIATTSIIDTAVNQQKHHHHQQQKGINIRINTFYNKNKSVVVYCSLIMQLLLLPKAVVRSYNGNPNIIRGHVMTTVAEAHTSTRERRLLCSFIGRGVSRGSTRRFDAGSCRTFSTRVALVSPCGDSNGVATTKSFLRLMNRRFGSNTSSPTSTSSIQHLSVDSDAEEDNHDIEEPKNEETMSSSSSSWMDRNQQFMEDIGMSGSSAFSNDDGDDSKSNRPKKQRYTPSNNNKIADNEKNDMFQSTRVWVQNIPSDASWQDLKDHFRVAGDVVYASISINIRTKQSKGCGVVQYSTVEEAAEAIKVMRDYPLITESTGPKGSKLYVREDYQEKRSLDEFTSSLRGKKNKKKQWTCANDVDNVTGNQEENDEDGNTTTRTTTNRNPKSNNGSGLTKEETYKILSILEARDEARLRKNYIASDAMREQLLDDYNVHIDDRLKLWWTHFDSNSPVPTKLVELKGEGRWGDPKLKPWRQIPTTPAMDALVDSTYVNKLLTQRDRARRKKEFDKADKLLEQARTSPQTPSDNGGEDIYLRIHDESRTWRIWTTEKPDFSSSRNTDYYYDDDDHNDYNDQSWNNRNRRRRHDSNMEQYDDTRSSFDKNKEKDITTQCMELIDQYNPEKRDEIRDLLLKFPGREGNILKKLKERYYGGRH